MADLLHKSPKISIIMPVYNSELFLNDTIKSILSQSFRDFELIIINDGSTDHSREIIEKFAAEDERIKAVHIKNEGPSKGRNTALNMARGQWIQFVDSDDVIDENMLMELYNNSTGYDMVVSGAIKEYVINGTSEECVSEAVRLNDKANIGGYLSAMNQQTRDLFLNYIWNRIIRRDIIEQNKIRFNENVMLGEDFIFICDVVKYANKINILNKAYYHYIIRGENSLISRFDKNEAARRTLMYHTFSTLMDCYGILDASRRLVMENEGRYCMSSLSKINFKRCNLSKKEKIEYIKSMLDPEKKECMMVYLNTQHGIKNKIKKAAVKIGNPVILYRLINKRTERNGKRNKK